MPLSEIEVELVFATPDKQVLKAVRVRPGATVREIIAASKIGDAFPDQNLDKLALGIWGKEVSGCKVAVAGDRIEIYRPLRLDPREARRQLALTGRTMGNANSD